MSNFLDKVKQLIGGVPQSLSNIGQSLNDDKGFFQQGKFTPIKAVQQGIQNWGQQNPVQAQKILNVPQQIKQQAGGFYTGITNPMRQTVGKNFGEQLGGTLATLPPSVTFGVPQLAGKIPQAVNFLSKIGKEMPFYSMVSEKVTEGVRKSPVGKVPYVPEIAGFAAPFFLGGISPKQGIKQLTKAEVEANFAKFGKQAVKDIPEELKFLSEKAKVIPKEKFIQLFNKELSSQNLTHRDTAQNIVKLMKKSGIVIDDFYKKVKPPVSVGAKVNTDWTQLTKQEQKIALDKYVKETGDKNILTWKKADIDNLMIDIGSNWDKKTLKPIPYIPESPQSIKQQLNQAASSQPPVEGGVSPLVKEVPLNKTIPTVIKDRAIYGEKSLTPNEPISGLLVDTPKRLASMKSLFPDKNIKIGDTIILNGSHRYYEALKRGDTSIKVLYKSPSVVEGGVGGGKTFEQINKEIEILKNDRGGFRSGLKIAELEKQKKVVPGWEMGKGQTLAELKREAKQRRLQYGVTTPPLSPITKPLGGGEVEQGLTEPTLKIKGITPETVRTLKINVNRGEVSTKGQPASNLIDKNLGLEGKTLPISQTGLPIANIPSKTSALKSIIAPKNPTREQVTMNLPNRIDGFIQKTLGYSTETPTGGLRGASGYTKLLRKGQENITRKIEQGLGSENTLVRNAASTLQNFFRGLGMSPERASASMELRGGISNSQQQAYDVMDSLYKSLNGNKESLVKINAVLDPTLAKNKVSLNQLTPVEKQVYSLIREGLDIVHDTSYANGHISDTLYQTNKGKYVPRLYAVTELPPEVNQFVTQGKRLANDLYKQRTSLNEWKIENSLNDPVYSLGKRLAQVQTNTAIKKYTNFLASNSNLVSDIEKAGFTKLSDSPAYGALSGKYVLNSAAEDLKGFFYANDSVNKLYDVFKAYDRLPIRQLQKKILTVFNPTTNVGNIVSDQVFGFVTGVNPLTLNKNLLEFKSNPALYKQLSNYLTKAGIVGSDITKTDFINKMGQINSLSEEFGQKQGVLKIISKVGDKVQSFYGGTDDVYKTSAFKALLDKGFSLEEATRKIADGFQNYANVGKFYDTWAKTPIIGSAFIKFQGDLIRIIKNGAVNNPLGLITFLGTLWGVARLSSKLSGESDEDRQTRENRFAAPMIPGLNIPLTWQTPMGEINAARYISPFYANNETTSISKMFPFVPNIQPKKDVASNIAINATDPLLGGLVQIAVNRDFRGKPISDPNENKYQPSTLTPQEKITNQLKFVGRAYTPPPINSAIDVGAATQGKPNMYGTPQTVPQAIARLGGIKISQYGKDEVQKIRDRDAEFQQYANESIDKQINSVFKQQLKGEITQEQTTNRINNLQSQKKEISINGLTGNTTTNGQTPYLNKAGDLKKIDTITDPTNQFYITDPKTGNKKFVDISAPIEYPKLTGNATIDKLSISDYKSDITARQKDVYALYQDGQLTLNQAQTAIDDLQKKYDSTKKGKAPKKISVATLKVSAPRRINIKMKIPKMPKFKKMKKSLLTFKKSKRILKIKV